MLPFDENEEAEFIYHKRRQNQGRTEGHFNEFYNELDSMLEEYGKAAHERRHSQTAYLPLAVSIPQLVAKVLQLLVYLPLLSSLLSSSILLSTLFLFPLVAVILS